ncbi:stalk domain-containing protein [Paenibacillaceae bacterium WGS1546]|uniref:stalk domain-containing protein n=1 Tax=Cohnella sp. WGS1546 TaxID=3366810 RepID=UPI00372D34DB
MKRLGMGLTAAALAFSLAGTASAASKPAPAVKVSVDGKAVDFGADLIVAKGKTYVEYASLFEQLGYGTDLDGSMNTIYAESDYYDIQIGEDIAIVNGLTLPSTGEIIQQDGRTLIGLRFAGLLANYAVDWDNRTKTASLAYQGPTDADQASINELFSKMLLVEAADDLQGALDLLAENTVVDTETVKENFENYKTQTKVLDLFIQSFNPTAAIVIATEESKKLSGDFYPDNVAQSRYTLHKNDEGEWRIYNVELLDMEFTDIPGMFKQAADIPEADKSAIGKAFEDQAKAANDKDPEAYVATLVDFPEKEQLLQALEEMFQVTNLNVTTEQWTVVQYDGSAKASLLVSMVSETDAGGQQAKIRSVVLNDAEKVDGKWLLAAEAYVLFSEEL